MFLSVLGPPLSLIQWVQVLSTLSRKWNSTPSDSNWSGKNCDRVMLRSYVASLFFTENNTAPSTRYCTSIMRSPAATTKQSSCTEMWSLPRQHTDRSAERLLRVPCVVYLAEATDILYCVWCNWYLAAELSRIRLRWLEGWTDSKTQVCKKSRQTIYPLCTFLNTSTVKVATDIQIRTVSSGNVKPIYFFS
jgi:hypothetical protein